MSEHTAGVAGVIVGGLAAGAVVVGGVMLALFVRRPEVGPGLEPVTIALGLCLTPVVIVAGAVCGSAVCRRAFRLLKA